MRTLPFTCTGRNGRPVLGWFLRVVWLLLLCANPSQALTQHFPPNSLIVPMSSAFQDPCGVVSAYGLIYRTLQANAWLQSQNQPKIQVHWVYADKKSPNRCVPTNLHPTPTTPAGCNYPYKDPIACNPLPYQDKNWNDGCDFSVTSTTTVPVTLVDNTSGGNATPASGCGNKPGHFCTRNTLNAADRNLSYPNYPSVVVQHGNTAAPDATVVQYLGGAFVIDAADAGRFLNLLNGTTKATDVYGNAIDFSPFSTPGKCSYGIDPTRNATVFTNGGVADSHYVNIHRAQVGFDASDTQRMNDLPGKVALLQTAGGNPNGGGIRGDMLPKYLASAGLNFPSAQGCPPGGFDAKNATGNCAARDKSGNVASGFIFDAFDVLDLQDTTLLNRTYTDGKGNTRYVYANLWTPHWEGSTFTYSAGAATGTCDQTCIDTARKTLNDFVKRTALGGSSGLLAECASIGVIEGGWNIYGPGGYWTYPANGTSSLADHRLMTCVADTNGNCAATNTGAAAVRGLQHEMDASSATIDRKPLRNCTDPDLAEGSPCMYYSQPNDGYSQVGDYLWFPRSGLLSNFLPSAGNAYRPGVSPLGFTVGSVKNHGPALNPTAARSQVTSDDFALYLAPTDGTRTNAAPVVYLGGHTYNQDVAGTRVVLNTMLALGVTPDVGDTAIAGPTLYNDNAFVSTYNRISTQNPPAQWQLYGFGTGAQWEFPYHVGDLRPHPVAGSITATANTLDAFNSFVTPLDGFGPSDAQAALPAAGARNIFTYLDGTISAGPGSPGPNAALQVGWVPVDIDFASVDPTSKSCVDKARVAVIDTSVKPTYRGLPYNALVSNSSLPGGSAAGDGVCDLHQMLELENIPTSNVAVDGAAGGAIPTAQLANVESAKAFIQMIRGYCFATDGKGNAVAHPANIQACDAWVQGFTAIQNDVPHLGGFAHSQVAIVPPSPYVVDLPQGKHRPTVAYIGGLDGMLHAFYVPSDTLDNGYTGAANQANYNADATSVFHTPLVPFAPTRALQELWAFIPPGQLPFLRSNAAMVDSSPVVIDVFGDFDGSGKRYWHTVLIASAGGSNRELFALDVSNPLKPVLLWDLQSNIDSRLNYAPGWLADDDAGLGATPLARAWSWQNGCHSGATGCTPSDYLLPPAGNPAQSGLYNYSLLGATQSVSAAQLRRNNAPLFAAFVGTNEPQDKADSGQGIYVFAIEAITGQKLWQFNNPYATATDPAGQLAGLGNTPPAGVTLLSKTGTSVIDTVYVGDEEGALWELDAADGLNLNSYASSLGAAAGCTGAGCCSGAGCNLALVKTWPSSPACGSTSMPQPISTLSTVLILPPGETGPLGTWAGQGLVAFGTAGTDTVAGLEPPSLQDPCGTATISGQVHLVPLGTGNRILPQQIRTTPALLATVQASGVARTEPAGFPLNLANGDRVYGSVVAAGDQLFFATTRGSVNQLDGRGTGALDGSTFRLNLGAALTSRSYDYYGNLGLSHMGGTQGTPVVDAKTGKVILTSDLGYVLLTPPAGATAIPPPGPSVNGLGQTPTGFLSWFFRRRGHAH